MFTRLDTDGTPPARRLALWQDIVCDVFVQLDCRSDAGDSFRGAIDRRDLGLLRCTEVVSSRQRVFRTPARIRRAREDFVLVAVGLAGSGGVVQDGREALIEPGQFALYDTTRPYELQFDGDFSQMVIQLPRAELLRRVGDTERLTATTFAGGDAAARPLERLTAEFLRGIARTAGTVGDEVAARLSGQAIDLLAATLSDRLTAGARATTTHRAALLYRLKAYIEAHLAEAELGIGQVAAGLGLSPRYVNDLLADERTSFRRYLLARRLDQCRRSLAAPAQAHLQIGEIAFLWGFNDLAHFSRAFKERFGLSPRAWRAAGGCRPRDH